MISSVCYTYDITNDKHNYVFRILFAEALINLIIALIIVLNDKVKCSQFLLTVHILNILI